MTRLTSAKLVLAGLGIAIFGWGIHADDALMRTIGIGLLAAGAVLRFARRKRE